MNAQVLQGSETDVFRMNFPNKAKECLQQLGKLNLQYTHFVHETKSFKKCLNNMLTQLVLYIC